MCSTNCKVWMRKHHVWLLLSMVWTRSSSFCALIMKNSRHFFTFHIMTTREGWFIHTHLYTQNWIDYMRFKGLDKPAQRSKLNPIKHVWDDPDLGTQDWVSVTLRGICGKRSRGESRCFSGFSHFPLPLFMKILNIRSSLKVRYQISQPYNITGNTRAISKVLHRLVVPWIGCCEHYISCSWRLEKEASVFSVSIVYSIFI